MKRAYSKPAFHKREALASITAGPVFISNVVNGSQTD